MSAVRDELETIRCVELSILCARDIIVERNTEPPNLFAKVKFADEECSTHVYAGGCPQGARHDLVRLHCTEGDHKVTVELHDLPGFHVGSLVIDLLQVTAKEPTVMVFALQEAGDFHAAPSLHLGELAIRLETGLQHFYTPPPPGPPN
mmetsp:Transcript_57668/g.158867  ORF Transcript_57668/g.158867 Transcript_57668/m.158867 type:complete len:148 (+) Transcript_57668:2736-3179(+)